MSPDLKQTRIDLGYSIDDIAAHLKIRKQYLLALEESRYDLLPGEAYVIGYLNSYCKFLKIQVKNTDIIDLQNKVIPPNDQAKYEKTQKYLLIISVISLFAIGVIYHQFFYVAADNGIKNYSIPASVQDNLR